MYIYIYISLSIHPGCYLTPLEHLQSEVSGIWLHEDESFGGYDLVNQVRENSSLRHSLLFDWGITNLFLSDAIHISTYVLGSVACSEEGVVSEGVVSR